ncbi:MAG: 2OG-Fe(II) oxygenase [Haliea sp.]|uniref:2OG-Fe(II) oxygenase n=1 Tax=Haliea sp. TaxID=1932666 RepID=UPI0032ED9816
MESAQRKHAYAGTLVMAEDPMVAVMEQVLTDEEMTHVIGVAGSRMQRARVSLDDSYLITEGRSGDNCWLSYDSDDVVARIGHRIAGIVGIPLSHAEAMQVIHYGVGQEYRAHYDAYDLATARGQRCCAFGGQRLVTALVYLNTIADGGGTAFPRLDVTIAAVPGRMVIFHNTGADESVPHPHSLHAGTPVVRGEKWAFNIWFHARPIRERQSFAVVAASEGTVDPALAPPPGVAAGNRLNDHFRTMINRASAIFASALKALGADIEALQEPVCFTYWDTYGNQPLPTRDRVAGERLIRLLDRRVSNPLAHKGTLAKLLRERGAGHLAPPTYDSIADALAAAADDTAVWYFKSVYGTGGKGMFCVAHGDLEQQVLPRDFILQAGVRDIELDAGRKFTTRIYLLVWGGELYFYGNGFTVTHGREYAPDSTDYAVQIDHRGYENANSAVKIAPGLGNPTFRRFLPALRQLAQALAPVLADCLRASDRDSYLLLGVDTLLCRDGTVKLIEINTAPNFIHSPEVNAEVNVPFFEAVIRTLLGGGDRALEKIEAR